MTDIELVLNSANKYTEGIVNEDTGAGAVSRKDTKFITTSPLSELVWSQQKGLSLKYAPSSLDEKKASLQWSTESFNIIISSPQLTNIEESSNTKDLIAGTFSSLQLKPNSANYDSNSDPLLGSPGSNFGVQATSLVGVHEPDLGYNGDEESLKRTAEAVLGNEEDRNQSDNKELSIYSPRNNESLFEILGLDADAFDLNHDNPSIEDPDNYAPAADSSFCNTKALNHDLAQEVQSESNAGSSPDYFNGLGRMENYKTPSFPEFLAYDDSKLAKHGSPRKLVSSSKSAECQGDSVNETNHHVTVVHPLCSDSGDMQSLDFQDKTEVSMPVVSQPIDEGKDENWQASHKDNSALIRCQTDFYKSSNARKGKEPLLSDEEDNVSISKEKEDSRESVESNNNSVPISKGKRALSFDSNISLGNKKFKYQRGESSGSGSLVRQSQSFLNWILTITNGYARSDQTTPLASLPHPSSSKTETNLGSLPKSHEKSNGLDISCRPTGFKSIFETLYCYNSRVQNHTSRDLELRREIGASKEHKVASKQFSWHIIYGTKKLNSESENTSNSLQDKITNESFHIGSLQSVQEKDTVKLHNQIKMSSEWPLQVEEMTSTAIDASLTNSGLHEHAKCTIMQTCSPRDMGSPNSSVKIISGHPEGKEADVLVSVPNDSLNLSNNIKSDFLESIWITRFFPKVSSSRANTGDCNQGMKLTSEKLAKDCNMLDPDNDASNWDKGNLGNRHPPCLEGQKDAANGDILEYSVFPTDPCGLKKLGNQNIKSKLTPILPSQKFKKSKLKSSTFIKRLDAFRHMKPSQISNEGICSTTTCLFCGNAGHNIKECSELVDYELEELLQNMNPFDGTDKSSCLCIRCFQINHWAISCPYASSKRKHNIDNASVSSHGKCNRLKNKLGNPCSSNRDGHFILWAGGKQEQHQPVSERNIPRREKCKVEAELVVNSNVIRSMAKVVTPNAKSSCLNSVNDDVGEDTFELNPISSGSREESKENQIIPFRNFVATEVTNGSVRVFEIIRRLRLSRMDIIRWMKSSVSNFNLDGFFLRLRLGKWEKSLRRVAYHVACINGAKNDNCLSVSIRGITYSIDCCSVSNHDFLEDELKSWWYEILKGNKPPTMEELNTKLQQRVDLGF